MDYLDFELCIGAGEGRSYPLSVVRSPAGEQRATMRFPFGELELKSRIQALQIALLKSGSTRRDLVASDEQTSVQDFGKMLFEAALPSEVRSCYRISRDKAKASGKGLRVRLRIEAPDLAALPWEFLYDAAEGDFVCLSNETPVVRYLELDRPPAPITIEPPLRILAMIAAPQDRSTLDVAREKARMSEAIADLEARGLVTLTWLEGQTWRDLQRAMRQGPWHVFHFVGHGGFDGASGEGMLALAGDDGNTFRLPATKLGRLLADHQSLRLAVLNACEGAQASDTDIFSSTASVLIRRGIPAVVAMQYEITDRAAIEFGHVFYQALAEGFPVDAAVSEARKAISMSVSNTVEWGTPVLHMRSPDGLLFDINAARAVPLPPPAPPPVVEKVAEPLPGTPTVSGGEVPPASGIAAVPPAPSAAPRAPVGEEEIRVPRKPLMWSLVTAGVVAALAVGLYFLLTEPVSDRPAGPADDPVEIDEGVLAVGQVLLTPESDTLRTGQTMRIGVALMDENGDGMSGSDLGPGGLEWTVDPPDLASVTPNDFGVGVTLLAVAPGTVTLTATVGDGGEVDGEGVPAERAADTKRVTILNDQAQINAATQRYLAAQLLFNDESVPDAEVLEAYRAFSPADRQALQESGVDAAQLDSAQQRVERLVALFAETRPATTSDTLTLAQKRARWRLYRGRADSVRSSPSTQRALAVIDSLRTIEENQASVVSLQTCARLSNRDCRDEQDVFASGSTVNVRAELTLKRSETLRWVLLGPDGQEVQSGRGTLQGPAAGYRYTPDLREDRMTTPGRYDFRVYSAQGHLIGRTAFAVE